MGHPSAYLVYTEVFLPLVTQWGMSLRWYRLGSRGYVEDDYYLIRAELLMVAPNEHQTMTEFMSQLISDVHIFGNTWC